MSVEAHRAGILMRLELTDDLVIIRYGNMIMFGKITHDDKIWIEGMMDTLGLEDTLNEIFKSSLINLQRTVA